MRHNRAWRFISPLVNRVHTEFERLMRQHLMPGQILKKLDEFINNDFGKMGIFLSAFCGMLDFSNNKLVYSNYGHPPQILFQPKNNNVYLMSSQTFLMGVGLADSNIYSSEVSFEKGDRLLLFTDGITEAKNKSGEMFGQKRLEEIAKNNKHLNVAEFNNFLINTIDKFQSNNQTDDIFILTIQSK